MPYMLNQYSPYPSPKVNYPTGDYRSISRLDRGKAELARTSQLEAEIARKKAWEDAIFQKKLEELQKSLLGGGAVGGSTQFAPQSRMGAMGRPTEDPLEGAGERAMRMNPEMAQYFRLMRGVAGMGPQGISGGYPQFGQGYNFMTLLGLGNPQLAVGGIFGKPIVPEAPGEAQMRAAYGGYSNPQGAPQQAGVSPGWATYKRPEVPPEVSALWGR